MSLDSSVEVVAKKEMSPVYTLRPLLSYLVVIVWRECSSLMGPLEVGTTDWCLTPFGMHPLPRTVES